MVEVDLENEWVDLAIKGVATIIGIAAGALVGGLFTPTISNQTGAAKWIFKAGQMGIETVTSYKVASTMNDDIHEVIECYNDISRKVNAGEKVMGREEAIDG